jgi:hypothetical protein
MCWSSVNFLKIIRLMSTKYVRQIWKLTLSVSSLGSVVSFPQYWTYWSSEKTSDEGTICSPSPRRAQPGGFESKSWGFLLGDYEERYFCDVIRSLLRLLITANVVPSLLNFAMEAIRSSEMSVFTRATRRNIPEDGILKNHYYLSFVRGTKWLSSFMFRLTDIQPFTRPVHHFRFW